MFVQQIQLGFYIGSTLYKDLKLVKQGAEAKIYTAIFEDNKSVIVKERFVKKYRHPDLDRSLTTKRIKNEVKLLNKAHLIGVNVPHVYKSDFGNRLIVMEFIQDSQTARDYILNLVKDKESSEYDEHLSKLSVEIGRIIGKLHKNDLIHGDLTTSNILFKPETINDNIEVKIYFIDFGLSFVSSQLEDKAVDLYVLERALLSTHSQQASKMFSNILLGYAESYGAQYPHLAHRLEQVRQRGRKRSMVG
jgi:TP53 regulating kinase-like protein